MIFKILNYIWKIQALILLVCSGPEELSRVAAPPMGSRNVQTFRQWARLHWSTADRWYQVLAFYSLLESRIWTYDIIAQKQLCVESTLFRQLQNRGLGQGGGGKGGACSTLDLSNMMEIQIYQVKFSLEKIQLVKRNESAWNYLRVSNCA